MSELSNKEILNAMSEMLDKKLNEQLQPIKNNLDNISNHINESDKNMIAIQNSIQNIQLTLENETNRNIMIIAEGHLDLSRKLDEALKIENEKEMLAIRVNILENELRQIKEKLATIA